MAFKMSKICRALEMAVVWEIRMDSEGRSRLQRGYTREQQRRLRGLCWSATLVECSRLLPRAGDGGGRPTLSEGRA